MVGERAIRYTAAGGVVICDDRVLVLSRPSQDEVRLPKGHVEQGESLREAALRETCEESGYGGLVIEADLGRQVVAFNRSGYHFVRAEHYFLMVFADGELGSPSGGEAQFEPLWLSWDKALAALTFEAEREWVRRARDLCNDATSSG